MGRSRQWGERDRVVMPWHQLTPATLSPAWLPCHKRLIAGAHSTITSPRFLLVPHVPDPTGCLRFHIREQNTQFKDPQELEHRPSDIPRDPCSEFRTSTPPARHSSVFRVQIEGMMVGGFGKVKGSVKASKRLGESIVRWGHDG